MEFLSKEGLTHLWSKLKPKFESLNSSATANTSEIAVQKARIDTITTLPSGSTTADAELMDIRVKADGTTASSAGNAVRAQVSDLKSHLSEIVDYIHPTEGAEVTNSGVTVKALTDDTFAVYGTATGVRQFCVFNGQHIVKFSTGEFEKTIDAGQYSISVTVSGYQNRFQIRGTYSTFANYFVVCSTNVDNSFYDFTNNAMLGFTTISEVNYGTEENPTVITFRLQNIIAKDPVAREELETVKSDIKSIEPIVLTDLIDANDVHIGEYLGSTSGDILTDTTDPPIVARTGYIDISEYTEIVYSRRTVMVSSSSAGIAFYNKDKLYISGVADIANQARRGYVVDRVSVPENAKYVMATIWAADVNGAFIYNAASYDSQYLVTRNKDIISSVANFPLRDTDIITKYIDTSAVIASLTPASPRLLVIPVHGIFSLNIKISVSSTKRYGFCDSLDASSTVFGYTELTGALDVTVTNVSHEYFIVQLFVNSDTEQDIGVYLKNTTLTITGNTDALARRKIYDATDGRFYHAECLHSIPILDSFSDITVDTASYNNCAAYHTLMGALCSNSNGFITQTLLGDDGHNNNLYKYVTHPKALKYGVARGEYAPTYPITGGRESQPLTVLLTADIHGREKSGNWVIYNLFTKMLSPDSEMLRFFRDRVRFVCIPYICASGTYNNADGININRDFPTTVDGTCQSDEATLVKSVIDDYGRDIFLHIDIHTFNAGSAQDHDTAGWIFTDSDKLGERCVITAESVLTRYAEKYPSIARLAEDYIGSGNIPTTCTFYTQTVYGAPSATMEAALTMDGSPSGADEHTSAVAYFYDIITQTICSMVD